jgi:hypothetical protein
MEFDEESIKERRKTVFAQKDQDLADLTAERAGLENGRITRFLHNDPRHEIEQKKQRDQEVIDAHLTALDILRQNAAYEAAYQQTMRFLTDLSQEAETAIEAATNMLDDLRNQRDTMLAAAPIWQVDQRLFRDKDGHVRNQHGEIIEGLTAEDVVWPKDTPTYEDWRALSGHARGCGSAHRRPRRAAAPCALGLWQAGGDGPCGL